MRIVSLGEIEQALDKAAALAAIEEGFRRFSAGEVQLSAVGHLGFPAVPGDCHIKGGYVEGEDVFVVKVATGFYRNRDLGLPTTNGFMAVFSAVTGEPLALLCDEGLLTDIRTAMAGAIAARAIARPGGGTLGVVGTGVQAQFQAEYVADAGGFDRILVWGRDPERRQGLRERLAAKGLKAEAVGDLAELCAESDLIVTTTNATEPLIKSEMVKRGARIVAVGADAPGKCELDPEIIGRADLIVADSREQCLDHGEIQHAARRGMMDESRLVELGSLLSQADAAIPDHAIVVADLTGLGVQDAQIAKTVWESVKRLSPADRAAPASACR